MIFQQCLSRYTGYPKPGSEGCAVSAVERESNRTNNGASTVIPSTGIDFISRLVAVGFTVVLSGCVHAMGTSDCVADEYYVLERREIRLLTTEPTSSLYYRAGESGEYIVVADFDRVFASLEATVEKYEYAPDQRLLAALRKMPRGRYTYILVPALSDPSLLVRIEGLLIRMIEEEAVIADLYAYPDDGSRMLEAVIVYRAANRANTIRKVCTPSGRPILTV